MRADDPCHDCGHAVALNPACAWRASARPAAAAKAGAPASRLPRRMARLAAALLAGVVLAGCAGLRAVDADVESHTAWPSGRTPGSYRFERLPSQAAQPQEQDRVEQGAAYALATVGFRMAGPAEAADVLVQAAARFRSVNRGWSDPFFRGDLYYLGGHGWYFSPGVWWMLEPSYYEREVSLLIRDPRTQQVLYETRARQDGPWQGDIDFHGALFLAALRDFPGPALNPRRVRVEVPLGETLRAPPPASPLPGAPQPVTPQPVAPAR